MSVRFEQTQPNAPTHLKLVTEMSPEEYRAACQFTISQSSGYDLMPTETAPESKPTETQQRFLKMVLEAYPDRSDIC